MNSYSPNFPEKKWFLDCDWLFCFADSSDFVRLDASLAEELPRALQEVMTSSSQSASSISDNFRFVPPLHRGRNPYREGA